MVRAIVVIYNCCRIMLLVVNGRIVVVVVVGRLCLVVNGGRGILWL